MDIYHNELLKKFFVYIVDSKDRKVIQSTNFNEKIVINQIEDIEKTKYTLVICCKSLKKIDVVFRGEKRECYLQSYEEHFGCKEEKQFFIEDYYYFDIDFDNYLPETIILYFVKDIVSPLSINLTYKMADKDLYYSQKEKEKIEKYKKKVNIEVSTGINLINISFQPCCEEYAYSKAVLFKENKKLGVFEHDKRVNYIAINKLGNAKYSIVLIQYDKDGKILYESDKKTIELCSEISKADDYDDYDDEYYGSW